MTPSHEIDKVQLIKDFIDNHFIAFGQFNSASDFETAKDLIYLMIKFDQLTVAQRCELRRYCDEIFYQESSENSD